jgi:hypothetical protein
MERNPRHLASAATKARQIARMLAEVLKESQKPGGSISLEEARREFEERDRRAGASRPRQRRRARRS